MVIYVHIHLIVGEEEYERPDKAFPGILAILWLDSRFLAQIRVYTLKGTENMRTMHRASKVITLVVTCLGFFMVLLQQTRRSLSTSVEPADSQATPGASTILKGAFVVEDENGVLLERGEQA